MSKQKMVIMNKMRQQPSNISFDEAVTILECFWFRQSVQRGSYVHFVNPHGDIISIKVESPVDPCYVREILKADPEE